MHQRELNSHLEILYVVQPTELSIALGGAFILLNSSSTLPLHVVYVLVCFFGRDLSTMRKTAPRMHICPLRQSNICMIEMRSVIFPFDIELHQKSQIFSMWPTGRGGNDRLLAANISKSEQLMPVKKLDDWGRKNVIPSQSNDCIKVNANYVATSLVYCHLE